MIIFSRIFAPTGVFEIGLKSLSSLGGLVFGMGTISDILYAFGKIPDLRAQFVIYLYGSVSSSANSLSILFGKSPGPKAFFENFFY